MQSAVHFGLVCVHQLIYNGFIIPDEGDDYIAPMAQQVTFTSGAVSNGHTACISIEIIDDNDFEEEHTFDVLLSSITPSIASVTGGLTTVEIHDNNGNIIKVF